MNFTSIISIVVFLIILTIIVFVHELGHFITAKKFGVYCKEFAIGMGPKLFGKKKGETEYTVRALPMGGFVQMIGEDAELFTIKNGQKLWVSINEDGLVSELAFNELVNHQMKFVEIINIERTKEPMEITYIYEEETIISQCTTLVSCYDAKSEEQLIVAYKRQFTNIKPWKKIIVLAAGATMNFIFAFIFFFVSTWISGVSTEPIIATDVYVQTGGTNALLADDKIVAIDGKATTDFTEISSYIQQNPGKSISLTINRNGSMVAIEREIQTVETQKVTSKGIENTTYGALGVTYAKNHTAMGKILATAVTRSIEIFQYVFFVIISLFSGKIKVTNLTGFVGIAQQTSAVISSANSTTTILAQAGEVFARLLSFAAFLSINIGAMNLLPLPALDGGRIVFALYEMLTKKKPSAKFENYANAAGFLLLIGLFIAVTIMDFIKLFTN
ncbi:MAG: M50 family metallopeptidase [Culicoidibacterales bacterium]